jgi:selenophosphate synthase
VIADNESVLMHASSIGGWRANRFDSKVAIAATISGEFSASEVCAPPCLGHGHVEATETASSLALTQISEPPRG